MISVQATNQGPEVSDRSWLQLRSPFSVGSIWSSGETRRPGDGVRVFLQENLFFFGVFFPIGFFQQRKAESIHVPNHQVSCFQRRILQKNLGF